MNSCKKLIDSIPNSVRDNSVSNANLALEKYISGLMVFGDDVYDVLGHVLNSEWGGYFIILTQNFYCYMTGRDLHDDWRTYELEDLSSWGVVNMSKKLYSRDVAMVLRTYFWALYYGGPFLNGDWDEYDEIDCYTDENREDTEPFPLDEFVATYEAIEMERLEEGFLMGVSEESLLVM